MNIGEYMSNMILYGVLQQRNVLKGSIGKKKESPGQIIYISDYSEVSTTTQTGNVTTVATNNYSDITARLPITFISSSNVLIDYTIYGKTSSLENQQNTGVGDYDETTDQYVIPITVTNDQSEIITTTLYLDAPLMDGDSMSMVEFGDSINVHIGQNTMTVGTTVQPSIVRIVCREVYSSS